MPRHMSLSAALVSSVAMLSGGVSAAHASSPFKLAASASVNGSTVSASRGLTLLDRRVFQVLKRTRSSVTVGYPATVAKRVHGKKRTVRAKPCAITTFRLSITPGADPSAFVAASLPNATRAAQVSEPPSGAPFGAWRTAGSIVKSSFLHVDGIAAVRTTPQALAVLTMRGHMTRINDRCGGTNSFTLGPEIIPSLTSTLF